MAKATARASRKAQRVGLIPRPLALYPLGRIEHEPIDTYHSTPAVSASKLRKFTPPRGRPATFYKEFVARSATPSKTEKESLRIGRASHVLILEGEQAYEERFKVAPYFGPPQSPVTIARFNGWKARYPGVDCLSATEDALNRRLARAVTEHADAMAILSEGQPEISWRLALEHYYIQCRSDRFIESASPALAARIAGMQPGDQVLVEVKTCGTLAHNGFGSFHRQLAEEYLDQVALYRQIIQAIQPCPRLWVVFIAVEKEAPHEAGVFFIDPSDLELATARVVATLELLDACAISGQWPGAGTGVRSLTQDDWWARRAQEHIDDSKHLAQRLLASRRR
jgi:hypothetical protein